MIFTVNVRTALPAAGHLHDAAGTPPVNNWGLVKFSNGELMGKKLNYSKFQKISNTSNKIRRPQLSMSLTTSIAGEAKVFDIAITATA